MKKNQQHVYGLILTLFIVGISIFFYRHFALDVPFTDDEMVKSYTVEANLKFNAATKSPVKASFNIPYMPPYFAIIDEYFVSHNYGVTTSLEGYNRVTVWSLRRAKGDQSLYYRAIFRETDRLENRLPKPKSVELPILSDSEKSAIDTISNQVRQSSADIQTFAQATVKELSKPDGNVKVLLGSDNSDTQIINAAIKVLNYAKIPAMQALGLPLSHGNKAEFKPMLAVYNGQDWLFIDPYTGSLGLPSEFLIWQYGDVPLYSLKGGTHANFNLTISPTPVNALSMAKARGMQTDSQLMRFSLLQLPIQTQDTYKVLLTVPIGAFIILLLRNFIGLKTFGTFMPVLIALAFRETHVIWGILLFIIIVSFGLLARFYLDHLRLLLVPRLAAILTVVIILMIFISILSQSLGLNAGLSIALFPMVILTMTIERMCITWDERGPADALKSGSGSLVAAVIAYWAMNITAVQYLLFAFPELLLVLLSIILLFGQYRGYRLFELSRFSVLASKDKSC